MPASQTNEGLYDEELQKVPYALNWNFEFNGMEVLLLAILRQEDTTKTDMASFINYLNTTDVIGEEMPLPVVTVSDDTECWFVQPDSAVTIRKEYDGETPYDSFFIIRRRENGEWYGEPAQIMPIGQAKTEAADMM